MENHVRPASPDTHVGRTGRRRNDGPAHHVRRRTTLVVYRARPEARTLDARLLAGRPHLRFDLAGGERGSAKAGSALQDLCGDSYDVPPRSEAIARQHLYLPGTYSFRPRDAILGLGRPRGASHMADRFASGSGFLEAGKTPRTLAGRPDHDRLQEAGLGGRDAEISARRVSDRVCRGIHDVRLGRQLPGSLEEHCRKPDDMARRSRAAYDDGPLHLW